MILRKHTNRLQTYFIPMPATTPRRYISASRRTDLPRFFYEQFFAALKSGSITYHGGYGRNYTVSLKPDAVAGFIFWSKDYSRFINHPAFIDLIKHTNAIFHYTINNDHFLEPGVPPLAERLSTLERLCDMVGPKRVLWRFDPICKYLLNSKIIITADPFFDIIPTMQKLSVTSCYFSFMSSYAKTTKRSIKFLPFSDEEKLSIAGSMLKAAQQSSITLYNCCNPEIIRLIPEIKKAHCIDEELLAATDRFGIHQSLKPKPSRNSCGCFESRDIGEYNPPCNHGCRYCYANPIASLMTNSG